MTECHSKATNSSETVFLNGGSHSDSSLTFLQFFADSFVYNTDL